MNAPFAFYLFVDEHLSVMAAHSWLRFVLTTPFIHINRAQQRRMSTLSHVSPGAACAYCPDMYPKRLKYYRTIPLMSVIE